MGNNYNTSDTPVLATDSAVVHNSLFDANSILAATTDDTPAALTVAASRILGRKASGGIAAMTAAELAALVPDVLLPRAFQINVFGYASANTNWSTHTSDTGSLYGYRLTSGGSQNDSVTFPMPFMLAPGTWRIDARARQTTANGIISVQLDDGAASFTEIATLDTYTSGASTSNVAHSATGIAISTLGLVAGQSLKLIMSTKNASSSSYQVSLNMLQFTRTA